MIRNVVIGTIDKSIEINVKRKLKGPPRKDNPETLATLDT
jgi:hypothetical protein